MRKVSMFLVLVVMFSLFFTGASFAKTYYYFVLRDVSTPGATSQLLSLYCQGTDPTKAWLPGKPLLGVPVYVDYTDTMNKVTKTYTNKYLVPNTNGVVGMLCDKITRFTIGQATGYKYVIDKTPESCTGYKPSYNSLYIVGTCILWGQ